MKNTNQAFLSPQIHALSYLAFKYDKDLQLIWKLNNQLVTFKSYDTNNVIKQIDNDKFQKIPFDTPNEDLLIKLIDCIHFYMTAEYQPKPIFYDFKILNSDVYLPFILLHDDSLVQPVSLLKLEQN